MVLQIAIGSGLILITVLISGLTLPWMEGLFQRHRTWLLRKPHGPKQMLVLCVALIWILGLLAAAIWIWAFAFWALGVFVTLEASVYFSLVAFTTLGFGDILLTQEWRLLAGMIAANGLLNIGMATAILVEALRQLRLGQAESRRPR
jgi:hypothetical protein